MYGCGTWTMQKRERKRIEEYMYRRVLNIKLSDKIKNKEILRRIGEESRLLRTIGNRKRNWIGQVLRKECLLRDGSEGTVEGQSKRRKRGRKMLDDLKDQGCTAA